MLIVNVNTFTNSRTPQLKARFATEFAEPIVAHMLKSKLKILVSRFFCIKLIVRLSLRDNQTFFLKFKHFIPYITRFISIYLPPSLCCDRVKYE
jgi:hypothetical protein